MASIDRPLRVLSCFDGMACGYEALKRAGIPVAEYWASEIDPYAITIAKKNHPDILHLGSITEWKSWELPVGYFDLIIGGSPCQGFSMAGKMLNFDDPRSKLYFDYEAIVKHYRPKWWLLENVKMKAEYRDVITSRTEVEPVLINSALVSAQNRQRYYWANFPITQPADRGILLKDVILNDVHPVALDIHRFGETFPRVYEHKTPTLISTSGGGKIPSLVLTLTESRTDEARQIRKESLKQGRDFSPRRGKELVPRTDNKANCLTSTLTREHLLVLVKDKSQTILSTLHKENAKSMVQRGKYGLLSLQLTPEALSYMNREVKDGRNHWDFQHHSDSSCDKSSAVVANFFKGVPYNVLRDMDCVRKFHPVECERLQTLQDGYSEGVSNTQRYRMIGNGWTVEVIRHIFEEMVRNG